MSLGEMTSEARRVLYVAVLAFAYRITGKSEERAYELTQEAFFRLMTTRLWDPNTQPSLERHMFGIVKSLLSAEHKSKRAEHDEKAGREHALLAGGPTASAETMSLDRARRQRAQETAAQHIAALRAKLAGHDLELSICELMADDVTKPADLVKRLNRTRAEVDAALRRIRRFMNSILAAERGEDEEVQ